MHSVLITLAVVWASSAVGVFCVFRKEMHAHDLPESEGQLGVRSALRASDGHLAELGSQNAHIALVHAKERVEQVPD